MFGGGGSTPPPPPPPPPPPNPPTYASAAASPSQRGSPLYTGLGSTIITSPLGTEAGPIQRKALLGS